VSDPVAWIALAVFALVFGGYVVLIRLWAREDRELAPNLLPTNS
jgi:hypothetical protein